MEVSYRLKKHGNLSLFEQDNMTAEDRKWWIERIEKDLEAEQEAQRGGSR